MAGYSSLICLLVGCLLASSVEGGPFKCNKQGRFPDPGNCGSYVDCFLDSDGEMIRREGDCWGFPYSPSKKHCVSHDERPGCKLDKPTDRILVGPITELKYHCTEKSSVGCHHCYIAYNCIDSEAYVDACNSGDSCTDISPFSGSCLPQGTANFTETKCDCNTIGTFGDHYNQNYYHFCKVDGNVTTYQCLEEEKYNEDSGNCESATTPAPPATPQCTGKPFGTYVNPQNCQYYYACLPNGDVETGGCKVENYYNETDGSCSQSCKFVEATPSPTEICPAAGKYRDPTDCTKYNICLGKDNLHKTDQCPIGSYFIPGDGEGTGGCESVSLPKECSDFDYSQCPDYDNLMPC